jgi:hypothetical protein
MVAEIASALALGKSALDILKQVKDLLPEGAKKEEATAKLIEAETKLKESQAKTAKELGYKLCQCTFPPSIVLLKAGELRCPECNENYSSFVG